jgi:hypothetical protein
MSKICIIGFPVIFKYFPETKGITLEKPDGTPVKIVTDYFEAERKYGSPTPVPFEKLQKGKKRIKIW